MNRLFPSHFRTRQLLVEKEVSLLISINQRQLTLNNPGVGLSDILTLEYSCVLKERELGRIHRIFEVWF